VTEKAEPYPKGRFFTAKRAEGNAKKYKALLSELCPSEQVYPGGRKTFARFAVKAVGYVKPSVLPAAGR